MHQSIYLSSSIPDTTLPPLTRANLNNLLEEQQLAKTAENEVLVRYCQEIHQSNQQKQPKLKQERKPSSYRSKCQSTHQDVVMASPKILPFPYHNDSYFLPTVEKMHRATSACSFSSSCHSSYSRRTDDASSLLLESSYIVHRPPSIGRSLCCSSIQQQRRSLPARLDSISKNFSLSSSCKQQQRLRRSTSCSVMSPPQQQNQQQKKKPWLLKRLLKIFNKQNNKHCKQQQKQQQQVWYCQYAKNPSPCFHQYYYSQQQQVAIVA